MIDAQSLLVRRGVSQPPRRPSFRLARATHGKTPPRRRRRLGGPFQGDVAVLSRITFVVELCSAVEMLNLASAHFDAISWA